MLMLLKQMKNVEGNIVIMEFGEDACVWPPMMNVLHGEHTITLIQTQMNLE